MGFVIIMIVFMIFMTILAAIYIYYCSENGVRMFSNPEYDERIRELEKEVKLLKSNIH